jgi:hypothetical protein
MRRSRKPLSVVRRIEGSNPSPSAFPCSCGFTDCERGVEGHNENRLADRRLSRMEHRGVQPRPRSRRPRSETGRCLSCRGHEGRRRPSGDVRNNAVRRRHPWKRTTCSSSTSQRASRARRPRDREGVRRHARETTCRASPNGRARVSSKLHTTRSRAFGGRRREQRPRPRCRAGNARSDRSCSAAPERGESGEPRLRLRSPSRRVGEPPSDERRP